ncbi:glycosyltransferase [Microbaculum sp. FT89]|uniref:glycosyltransferase n=1 Tax=Microbaculum sp. FT89 TaxID=3447298 RepID=UPI003F52D9DE
MTAEGAVRREAVADLPSDVAFLTGRLPLEALEEAVAEADRLGACAHELLLSRRLVSIDTYYRALAAAVGARFVPIVRLRFPADPFAGRDPALAARLGMLVVANGDGTEIACAPRGQQVAALVETLAVRPVAARQLFITTPQALSDAVVACAQDHLVAIARNGGGRLHDGNSARRLLDRRQAVVLAAMPLAALLAALAFPVATLQALTGLFGLFFLGVIGLRLTAAVLGLLPSSLVSSLSGPPESSRPLSDRELPDYTVLVPLYREAALVPGLIAALARLDYPAHRLDIKIVAEADDAETLAVLRRAALPPQVQVVVVPDAAPKTKPKALGFALAFARGAFVTVFDAEDLPDPRQLRRAAERFAAEPEDIVCLQARLAWYNWPESWFTRQLALEYASLFEVFLPALERLGLPFPLGGTSNHFRIRALRAVGGWDAYNVTEDADLGLRLARAGYRCKTLRSTTLEEAPVSFRPWLCQRTRWMKGWIQTYLVHMRAPGDLMRRLGPVRFLGIQAIFGGVVVSAFVHPIFLAVIAVQVLHGDIFLDGGGPVDFAVNWLGVLNLIAGYLAGFALALAGLRHRPMWWLVPELALLPVYWLTMSIAAVRAVAQLCRAPHLWEKTEHGLTGMAPVPPDLQAYGKIGAGDRDRTDDIQLGKRRQPFDPVNPSSPSERPERILGCRNLPSRTVWTA